MSEAGTEALGFTHTLLDVGDVQLHYAELGVGDPVVFIAGWPQTWYAWRRVVPLLAAKERRALVLDPRGFGSSRMSGPFDLDTVAKDVHQLLKALNLNKVDVVSHDVGSWISYALASDYPEDVDRLVLSEMTIQTPGASRPIPGDRANFASWHFAFNRLPELPEALVAGRESLFLDWLFDHKAKRPEAIDAAARAHYARAFAAPGAAKAGFEYYRALLSGHGLQRMAERVARPLSMPVLAIGADGGVGDQLAISLDNSTVELHSVVLAGGHFLPEEAPASFSQAVFDFWEATVSTEPAS